MKKGPVPKYYLISSGFTLIELLIVISIIVILAAVGVANYATVSKKGRDSRRMADLEQIRGALELYRADEGSYPGTVDFPSCGGILQSGAVIYMKEVPCDPDGSSYGYERIDQYNYNLGAVVDLDDNEKETNCPTGITCGSIGDDDVCYCITNP